MKAIDAVRMALSFGDGNMRWLQEMTADPLRQPGPWGGNHAMWIAGHLTVNEGRLHKMLRGTPNPVENWKPLFDWGSAPKTDPADYPPFDHVLKTFRGLREGTYAYLDEVGDEGLDRPPKLQPPGKFGLATAEGFATVAAAIMTVACHQCFHTGQASIARRAIGKQPVFVPSKALQEF